MLVLGGGGYSIRNVARCWCYETSRLLNQPVPDQIPWHEDMDYYLPDYKLHIPVSNMKNENRREELEATKAKLLQQLSNLEAVPSVQMKRQPDALICAAADEDEEEDDDVRRTATKRHHLAEFFEEDDAAGGARPSRPSRPRRPSRPSRPSRPNRRAAGCARDLASSAPLKGTASCTCPVAACDTHSLPLLGACPAVRLSYVSPTSLLRLSAGRPHGLRPDGGPGQLRGTPGRLQLRGAVLLPRAQPVCRLAHQRRRPLPLTVRPRAGAPGRMGGTWRAAPK